MHRLPVILEDALIYKMKLIAIIAMSLTLDRVWSNCSSKCSSTEFLTPEGCCCRNPQLGKCMKILANCTRFTDTKCDPVEGCTKDAGEARCTVSSSAGGGHLDTITIGTLPCKCSPKVNG
ncbi:hypothetical protein SKAU_G00156520 [Synaphobranchus kaupii]|uniref:Uncharacterized protein n=1 Tax=Synaphobranchus kaupii TaxID=118154 RepID=A0A9Q1FI41_SYNKA|nr:hypothetical protein SKAU_G00156520 [Synaphobranchus kaupii]